MHKRLNYSRCIYGPLTNLRPISLLNVDYKVLAKRLRPLPLRRSHRSNVRFPGGPSIQDNLHLIRNIVDYSNAHEIEAAVVSYDQAKAFDRVSHLFNVLRAFGASEKIVNCVARLVHGCRLAPNYRSNLNAL